MAYSAVRIFNGACDPHWSTPEGQAEWGGYATFDHHLGGGNFKDAVNAIWKFLDRHQMRIAKERKEYDAIMAELRNPTPRNLSFVYNQDIFKVIGNDSSVPITPGVRNFNDPRINSENGKIVRSDGKVRRGWWWV